MELILQNYLVKIELLLQSILIIYLKNRNWKKKEKAAEKKPSILQKLKKFKEKVASMPRRDKEKRKEREL